MLIGLNVSELMSKLIILIFKIKIYQFWEKLSHFQADRKRGKFKQQDTRVTKFILVSVWLIQQLLR